MDDFSKPEEIRANRDTIYFSLNGHRPPKWLKKDGWIVYTSHDPIDDVAIYRWMVNGRKHGNFYDSIICTYLREIKPHEQLQDGDIQYIPNSLVKIGVNPVVTRFRPLPLKTEEEYLNWIRERLRDRQLQLNDNKQKL